MRRKLDVGVPFGAVVDVVVALPSELVSEVDMIAVGVAVGVGAGVAVVWTSGSLSGGVLGEQSSSSWRLADRNGSYLSLVDGLRPLFRRKRIIE